MALKVNVVPWMEGALLRLRLKAAATARATSLRPSSEAVAWS